MFKMNKITEAVELMVILALVVACHVARNVTQAPLPAFDKEGHRGCRGVMPENTIPAMLKAVDLGVTTLEMDAVITKDKQVILSHEPFFNHAITTRANGQQVSESEEKGLNIFQMTYAETQQYDVGLKPHPQFPQQHKIKATKPLLSDVIKQVEAYVQLKGSDKVFYNIETKSQPSTDSVYHPDPETFVDLLVKEIENNKIVNRVIIQSFDFRTLKILHRKYPHIRTSALIGATNRPMEQQIQDLGFNPTIYSPHYLMVNKELVDKCHQQQIRIVPWTVNDKATIDKLRSLGVDGIITDYPNLF
jgi:glycerophosphoryl diester phosphodiesterase